MTKHIPCPYCHEDIMGQTASCSYSSTDYYEADLFITEVFNCDKCYEHYLLPNGDDISK